MHHTSVYCTCKGASEKDINTTKFLELLLQYDYVYRSDCQEAFKLNLSQEDKLQFLKQCSEFLQDLDEENATKKLVDIRHVYHKHMQKNVYEKRPPWFSLADALFRRAPTSTVTETPLVRSQILQSPGSNSQSFTEDVTVPSLQGENLAKKQASSFLSEHLEEETNITSENKKCISRHSKPLPSSSEYSLAPLVISTPFLCLVPPITSDGKVARLNVNNVSAVPDLPNTDLISDKSSSTSLATRVSFSSSKRVNIPPSACSPTVPSQRTRISPLARLSFPMSAKNFVSPTSGNYILNSEANSTSSEGSPTFLSQRSSSSPPTCNARTSSPFKKFGFSPVERKSASKSSGKVYSIPPYARSPISPSATSQFSECAKISNSGSAKNPILPSTRSFILPCARSSYYPSAESSDSAAARSNSPSSGSCSSSSLGSCDSPSAERSISPSPKRSISPYKESSVSRCERSFILHSTKRFASPSTGIFHSDSTTTTISPSERCYTSPSKKRSFPPYPRNYIPIFRGNPISSSPLDLTSPYTKARVSPNPKDSISNTAELTLSPASESWTSSYF